MKTGWKIILVLVLLFAAGARWVSYDIARMSSFIQAAYAGQTDVIAKMLKNGEYVDVKDLKYGATALVYAAQEGHIDTVKFLLDNHADINIVTKLGQTPLSQAAFHKHLDIVKLLIERGAKLDARLRPSVVNSLEGNPDIIKLLPAEEPEKK
jgi:ankyrin repeat protein